MTEGDQIQDYLSGVDYPTRKDQLIRVAKQNNAPQDIVNQLDRLPDDRQFDEASDVDQILGLRTQRTKGNEEE